MFFIIIFNRTADTIHIASGKLILRLNISRNKHTRCCLCLGKKSIKHFKQSGLKLTIIFIIGRSDSIFHFSNRANAERQQKHLLKIIAISCQLSQSRKSTVNLV